MSGNKFKVGDRVRVRDEDKEYVSCIIKRIYKTDMDVEVAVLDIIRNKHYDLTINTYFLEHDCRYGRDEHLLNRLAIKKFGKPLDILSYDEILEANSIYDGYMKIIDGLLDVDQ